MSWNYICSTLCLKIRNSHVHIFILSNANIVVGLGMLKDRYLWHLLNPALPNQIQSCLHSCLQWHLLLLLRKFKYVGFLSCILNVELNFMLIYSSLLGLTSRPCDLRRTTLNWHYNMWSLFDPREGEILDQCMRPVPTH